jgi:hypothetical protein
MTFPPKLEWSIGTEMAHRLEKHKGLPPSQGSIEGLLDSPRHLTAMMGASDHRLGRQRYRLFREVSPMGEKRGRYFITGCRLIELGVDRLQGRVYIPCAGECQAQK